VIVAEELEIAVVRDQEQPVLLASIADLLALDGVPFIVEG
jgi:hypothetical protein